MSSGKAKKQQLQEQRERERAHAAAEAAKMKAQAAAADAQQRARAALEGGLAAAPASPAVAHTAPAAVPAPARAVARAAADDDDDDDDEWAGIKPVRRVLRGAAAPAAKQAATASAASSASAAASSSSSAAAATPAISAVPASTATAGAPTNRLRSTFARESDEVIEARKAASRLPLQRDPASFAVAAAGGGTPSGDYYARNEIAIPVRPDWHGLTAAQVEAQEVAAHAKWLEDIYSRFDANRLNHFEHNLEVWRQLWRVCERSDILLVVVDSRQPLLNFPPSLYHYITDSLHKPMVVVLNKIDLLPAPAVEQWVRFFKRRFPKLHVVPFSSFPSERREALDGTVKSKAKRGKGRNLLKPFGAAELLEACRKIVMESDAFKSLPESVRRSFSFEPTLLTGGSQATDKDQEIYKGADDYMRAGGDSDEELGASSLSQELKHLGVLKPRAADTRKARREQLKAINQQHAAELTADDDATEHSDSANSDDEADAQDVAANTRLYSNALGVLEEDDHSAAAASRPLDAFITIGCLGQPNAGKSSLINALAGKKLLSVSITPGHTKYLQTLFLNRSTRLCDCPGLVAPAVDMPKAVQVIAGSYPIAQTRDPYSAVQFLAERLPLETIYKLTPPAADAEHAGAQHRDDASSSSAATHANDASAVAASQPYAWSAWSICEAVATKKGFFTRQGAPDVYRAANFILREALDGKISLYFTPPQD